MSSGFGMKRKPRKIQTEEEEEEDAGVALPSSSPSIRNTNSSLNPGRKSFKKSSLRQSITIGDANNEDSYTEDAGEPITEYGDPLPPVSQKSNAEAPVFKKKKKKSASRLSFGPGEIISGDAAEALEDSEFFTPKKSVTARRIDEPNSLRKSLSQYQIPIRGEDDAERPTYSKDYLNQLKASTPTAPKDLPPSMQTDEDEGLDESELNGATIVETGNEAFSAAAILSEAEIREKKERRARLAHEQDFISLNDSDGGSYQQVSLLPQKKKDSRLVREDEDLAEGFDEFVDDGRISLGKKAEREAKQRQRAQMAELIQDAEGSSEEESDASEAERRAAYEAAQTRAGMDGLSKPDPQAIIQQVPAKITPIPNLSECLSKLQATLTGMQQELAKRTKRMADLQQEKQEILTREEEVQRLLKEAGERYSALRGDAAAPAVDASGIVDKTGLPDAVTMNRGLESFGNTPVGRSEVADVG